MIIGHFPRKLSAKTILIRTRFSLIRKSSLTDCMHLNKNWVQMIAWVRMTLSSVGFYFRQPEFYNNCKSCIKLRCTWRLIYFRGVWGGGGDLLERVTEYSGGNLLFPVGGAKPSKFPTKLSNFRQTPPFALEKAVFSPLLGQNFRKFVIFHEGGGAAAPRPTEISATDWIERAFTCMCLEYSFIL
jgi:hypothetical protein